MQGHGGPPTSARIYHMTKFVCREHDYQAYITIQNKYQKWMKTRPRLKAPDMYATGCETRKGSPNNICSSCESGLE
jgi:hypothetical protein